MANASLARHLLRAKDLADARYFESLSVADLAAAAHLSPAYFSRQFKRVFGESPHQYLLTRRLERVANLLRTTDWSTTDICFAVGAQSVGSFTTAFRRMFGRTPLDYRAMHHLRSGTCASLAASHRPTGALRTARFEKTVRSRPFRLDLDRTSEEDP